MCVRFCSHTTLTSPPSTCQTCRDLGNKLVFSKSVDACWGRPEYVSSLEHVQARLTLSHNQRGKLAIHLISPLGTRSTLLFPRYTVKHTTNTSATAEPEYKSLFACVSFTHLDKHNMCMFVCLWSFISYLCTQTPTSMLSGVNLKKKHTHTHTLCAFNQQQKKDKLLRVSPFLSGPMTSPQRDSTTGPL